MQEPREGFFTEVVNALDGIRADNRENRQRNDTPQPIRRMDDDVMQFIERGGYCQYIMGPNFVFVRTLTEKGYDVLTFMDFQKYLTWKAKGNAKTWWPIRISAIALVISFITLGLKFNEWREVGQTESKIELLDSSLKSLTDSLNAYRLPSKVYTANGDDLKSPEKKAIDTVEKGKAIKSTPPLKKTKTN